MTSGDGIALPQKVLFPPERLCLKWNQGHRIGAGLHNLGNTCFLNSTLQCLTYTAPLANYMLTREHSKTCKCTRLCKIARNTCREFVLMLYMLFLSMQVMSLGFVWCVPCRITSSKCSPTLETSLSPLVCLMNWNVSAKINICFEIIWQIYCVPAKSTFKGSSAT